HPETDRTELVSCAVFVFLGWQLGSVRAGAAGAAEPEDQVQIQVLFRPEECNRKSKKGDLINAHYDGFLEKDGSQFYCSRSDKQGHPQWFVLGVGQVIRGLDVGMMDMCAGEKRKVTVPAALAFGQTGKGWSAEQEVDVLWDRDVLRVFMLSCPLLQQRPL
uniref:peptidylprolyl isomerase n=1 Tax=Xiphophorus couchianus TaxID=32473 RepID=A0A3B5MKC9_9TELE